MKYFIFFITVLIFISCKDWRCKSSDVILSINDTNCNHDIHASAHYSKKIVNNNAKEKHKIVEAVRLTKLLPKKKIIDEMIDDALFILCNDSQQKYLLEEYKKNKFDCYFMSISISNYGDTTCSIIPGWLSQHVFLSNECLGYYTRNGYHFFLSGDAASFFFKESNRKKTFYSGTPIISEKIISIPVFVVSNNNYWQIY